MGLREKRLAEHFTLLPATLEALSELAERFDLPEPPDFNAPEQDLMPPPELEPPFTVSALRDSLGEETFQWLCACAVYPELHWELTLYFGSLPCMATTLIREESLFRLIRLPWFREGSLPGELRLQLIAEIQPERERAIRTAIIELLQHNPPKEGSFAADARRLEIAVQRGWLSRHLRKEFRQAVEEFKNFPPADIARDYALVRFLESAPKSRLAMLLPAGLKKLFYERGIQSFGLRTGVRALATVAAMVALFGGLSWLIPPPPPVKANVNATAFDFKMEMIELPGGTFTMGAPASEKDFYENEGPQHQVKLNSFAIGKYEVTQAQWRAVAALPKVNLDLNPDPSQFKGDSLPVETVSWEEATEFCQRLSVKTGMTFRLPTEAEWEFAARAGTNTRFSFGDDEKLLGDYAWYGEGADGKTHPVGQKKQNAWELFDMHGNVWEWCSDWYGSDYYAECQRQGVVTDPQGPSTGSSRVFRGGGWILDAVGCRSALRDYGTPGGRDGGLGFRLVRIGR